jgi:uncharacterized protein YndB with AHSA1/START domain
MNKVIRRSIRLKCTPHKAFEMFTLNEHLDKWLTQVADVQPKKGGKYELFWNPEDKENDSTIGCKVLALHPGSFLVFEWKGPKQFKHFMNNADPLTQVVVLFTSLKKGTKLCTGVNLIHSGWRSSAEWEEARQWFERAWANALSELEKYVESRQTA